SPSTLGSFKSSRTRRGGLLPARDSYAPRQKRNSSASSPSRTTWTFSLTFSLRKAWRVSSTSFGLSSTSKISVMHGFKRAPFRCRYAVLGSCESEIECRAGIQFGLRPDPAPVFMDDPLDGGEADAGPFEILLAVQPLKNAKQLIAELHAEAYAVVSHENGRLAIDFLLIHLYYSLGARTRELHGVGQQIRKNLL